MPKKTRKTAKSKKRTELRRSPARPAKVRTEVQIAELAAPAHVRRFIGDVLTRGEAGALKNGKLAPGKTHILKTDKGSAPTLVRARYNLVG